MPTRTPKRAHPALVDLPPAAARLRDDVVHGLALRPAKIPPKYFYDDRGAALFDRITELDAYYLTRTEIGILRASIHDIARVIGHDARIVEFGSGSGIKTRILLQHLHDPASYIPVDISRAQLIDFAATIAGELPQLEVAPVCADYTTEFALPLPARASRRTVAFFPGSTIGNFEAAEARAFLRSVRRLCGAGGGLVIGTDLHKTTDVLEHAYNDPAGVTAAFNLNLLARINRECGANFDLHAFQHRACYDDVRRRIEMQLVAVRDTSVTLPACGPRDPRVTRGFAAGEAIITEYSHKYTLDGFRTLALATGWEVERVWTDAAGWFAVWGLTAV